MSEQTVAVSKQQASLNTLIERLTNERGLAENAYTTETQADGKLLVIVDLPNFPTISIGKQGGVDMPEIRSYPQVKGGLTAMDAAVKGDEHLARQNAGRTRRVAAQAAPAQEAPANQEAPAQETPATEEQAAPVEAADPNVAETTVTLE